MIDKNNIIKITNLETDNFASIMLNDLKKRLINCYDIHFDKIEDIKTSNKNEKCDLTSMVNFAVSVGAGIVSSVIIELLKSVYAYYIHNKDYKWKLFVEDGDKCFKVVVYKKAGVVLVDIQNIDSEDNEEV